MITVYCWLLCLYPGSYRHEFGEEMTSVFRDAQGELPGPARVSFYGREFCGLLSGALRVHFDRLFGEHLFGPGIPFRRFDMQPQFRFPRSTVFLMLAILAGVVLAIRMAAIVAGDKSGAAWHSVAFWSSVLVFMLPPAAIVWYILHVLGRSGVHRLENVRSGIESNGNR
jgi:hypothetical protein